MSMRPMRVRASASPAMKAWTAAAERKVIISRLKVTIIWASSVAAAWTLTTAFWRPTMVAVVWVTTAP